MSARRGEAFAAQTSLWLGHLHGTDDGSLDALAGRVNIEGDDYALDVVVRPAGALPTSLTLTTDDAHRLLYGLARVLEELRETTDLTMPADVAQALADDQILRNLAAEEEN